MSRLPTSNPVTTPISPTNSVKPSSKPSRSPTTRRPTNEPTTAAPTISKGYQPAVCANGPLVMKPDREGQFNDVCTVWNILNARFNNEIENLETFAKFRFIGVMIRNAFHDAGEFDQNSDDALGPDGCLSIDPDNFGLLEPDTPLFSIVEPWWQDFACTTMSRADFWILVANLVYRRTCMFPSLCNSIFDYGRPDNLNCEGGKGRLPSAMGGPEILQKTFVDQMGLTLVDAGT